MLAYDVSSGTVPGIVFTCLALVLCPPVLGILHVSLFTSTLALWKSAFQVSLLQAPSHFRSHQKQCIFLYVFFPVPFDHSYSSCFKAKIQLLDLLTKGKDSNLVDLISCSFTYSLCLLFGLRSFFTVIMEYITLFLNVHWHTHMHVLGCVVKAGAKTL